MSNVLKGFFVSVEDDKRVVDSNSLVEVRIREEEERRARLQAIADGDINLEEGFTEGLPFANVDALLDEDSTSAVIKATNQDELEQVNAQIEDAKAYLEELNSNAEQIIEGANIEAEQIKAQAFESAQAEGYQAGYNEGLAQVEALKTDVLNQANELQSEYEQKLAELEPLFIDKITDIYEHVFKVDLSAFKGIVTNLLIDTINSNNETKNIIVHISKEDYPDIAANKEFILTETGMQSDNVEFIQDATLGVNGCIIETDNGIFDCSLDTELMELKKKLTLLSYR